MTTRPMCDRHRLRGNRQARVSDTPGRPTLVIRIRRSRGPRVERSTIWVAGDRAIVAAAGRPEPSLIPAPAALCPAIIADLVLLRPLPVISSAAADVVRVERILAPSNPKTLLDTSVVTARHTEILEQTIIDAGPLGWWVLKGGATAAPVPTEMGAILADLRALISGC